MTEQLGLDLGDVAEASPRPPAQRPAGAAPPRRSACEIARVLGRHTPTPEQVAVIEAPVSPLLVIAGAGSGKTETMAARVVWLVANGLVEPSCVLGLTFTRKAAGELAERIRARLRALHRHGLGPEPEPVPVSTYHAYAASVLTDHGLRLGVEPGARVLGEAGAWQMVDQLVERWDGDMTGVEASRRTVVDAVLALAGECAEHLVDGARVDAALGSVLERIAGLPRTTGDAAPGAPMAKVREVAEKLAARRRLLPLVEAYVERKRLEEVLDFGDQVALAARLARDVPEVRAGERERFRVVLLDEYQDTSHAQLVLLQSLFGQGHPVTAVGDPHQSIYGWRGASAGNLQRFPEDFPDAAGHPASVQHLSTSWRNDRAVLEIANRVAVDLRVPPPWLGGGERVEVPPLLPAPTAGPGRVRLEWHATVEDEVRAVADLVADRWHGPGGATVPDGEAAARPSLAVLCRTRSQFPLIEAALRARGLPVEVVGLGGLLHVPEVADLRATLEVIHDPTRGDSLMRLLTGPVLGLGAPDLDALGAWASCLSREGAPRAARLRGAESRAPAPSGDPADPAVVVEADAAEERSIVDAIDCLAAPGWQGPAGQTLTPQARARLERFAGVLRGLRARVSFPLPELVLEAERALLLDVEVAARPGVDPASARVHLDAFLDVVSSFCATGDRPTLGALLGWLDAADARERALEPGAAARRPDAVHVLTVHGAKGLEWDVVAVAGLVEGTFPSGHGGRAPAASSGWLTDAGALPYPLRGDADDLPRWRVEAASSQKELAAELESFRADCGAHEVSEERRLAYVAVTRARSELVMTGSLWGDGARPRRPSRFLTEAAELAGGRVPGPGDGSVVLGTWTDPPEDGAENPREALSRPVPWPVDPLGGARPAAEHGAALVRAAMDALTRGVSAPRVGGPVPGSSRGWSREVDVLLLERDAARTRGVTVELPAHLSVSRLVHLADDPVALTARLRRPVPEPPSPHARRGSAFHTWLERRFSSAALLDLDDLPGAADDAEADTDLDHLQEAFLASEWAGRIPEAVEVSVETPVGGVVVRGRIDAVFRDAHGRWEVVDWKTGMPPTGRNAEVRAVQLAVYRLAWARLQGVDVGRVGASFFYAGCGRTVRAVDLLDERGLESLVERALALAGPRDRSAAVTGESSDGP